MDNAKTNGSPTTCIGIAAGVALAAALSVPAATAQESGISYTPVTDERLRAPDPGDWLMYRGTYDSWGFRLGVCLT